VPSEGTNGNGRLRSDLTHVNIIEVPSIKVRVHVWLIRRDNVNMLIRSNVSGAEASSTLRYIGRLMGRGMEILIWIIKSCSWRLLPDHYIS